MKKQFLSKWKYIVISNDSHEESNRYELDENERLKEKMKRMKKRSLLTPYLQQNTNTASTPNKSQNKLQLFTKEVFSYNEKLPNDLTYDMSKASLPPFTFQFSFLPVKDSNNINTKPNNEKDEK